MLLGLGTIYDWERKWEQVSTTEEGRKQVTEKEATPENRLHHLTTLLTQLFLGKTQLS